MINLTHFKNFAALLMHKKKFVALLMHKQNRNTVKLTPSGQNQVMQKKSEMKIGYPEIAKRTNGQVCDRTVSRFIHDFERVQIKKASAIAKVLNLKLKDLIYKSDEESTFLQLISIVVLEFIKNLQLDAKTEQFDHEENSTSSQEKSKITKQKKYRDIPLPFHRILAQHTIFRNQPPDKKLQYLLETINNKHWLRVLLFATEMFIFPESMLLLLNREIHQLVAANKPLQDMLSSINRKSTKVKVSYEKVVVRAVYLERLIDLILGVYYSPNDAITDEFAIDVGLINTLIRTLDAPYLEYALHDKPDGLRSGLDLLLSDKLKTDFNNLDKLPDRSRVCPFNNSLSSIYTSLEKVLRHELQGELRVKLQELKSRLPKPDTNKEMYNQWKQNYLKSWRQDLRKLIIDERDIGHDWQLSQEMWRLLILYYNANKLLVECMNNCNLNPDAKQGIRERLLLP
ncbi:NACHT C-terminal helical domain 2-containing protein [Nostoc sp.]|uniref:NACHT C-terminal helical domain 2-containing protein n=1 Tax=Nostoc sp. TaxID=1180 RepID=UPI002FFCB3E5